MGLSTFLLGYPDKLPLVIDDLPTFQGVTSEILPHWEETLSQTL